MKTISIRLALPAERVDLEQLQWRASLNNPGDRAALLANPDAIVLPREQIEGGQVFVAENGNGVVGFAAVLDRPDHDIELDGLFVDPAYWRQGIGRALIDYCTSYAHRRGSGALHVVGNPHARAFYESVGFVSVGLHKTRLGEGILMQRPLQA